MHVASPSRSHCVSKLSTRLARLDFWLAAGASFGQDNEHRPAVVRSSRYGLEKRSQCPVPMRLLRPRRSLCGRVRMSAMQMSRPRRRSRSRSSCGRTSRTSASCTIRRSIARAGGRRVSLAARPLRCRAGADHQRLLVHDRSVRRRAHREAGLARARLPVAPRAEHPVPQRDRLGDARGAGAQPCDAHDRNAGDPGQRGLSGTAERIAMQWLLSVAGYLLSVVDTEGRAEQGRGDEGGAPGPDGARARSRSYYDRAGEKTARLVYFSGMMIGVAVLAVRRSGAWVYVVMGDFRPQGREHEDVLRLLRDGRGRARSSAS